MKDYKWYIGIIILIAGIVYGVLQYHNLPKKVETNTSEVQQLAQTVEKYRAVQEVRDAGQEKTQAMIVEWIKEDRSQ